MRTGQHNIHYTAHVRLASRQLVRGSGRNGRGSVAIALMASCLIIAHSLFRFHSSFAELCRQRFDAAALHLRRFQVVREDTGFPFEIVSEIGLHHGE